MSAFHAFFFGLLQGITEFLPVSSSAHLKCAKLLFGIESSEGQILFDLVCHLGTLIAVLVYFRRELFALFTIDRKKLSLLCIATLPLAPCYFLLKPLRDLCSTPQCLGACLMVTSFILFLGQSWRVRSERVSTYRRDLKDVLFIGTMQASALIPGISRSASTISCARILGWSAQEAVAFSFLLSIPTVIGGNCLEVLKITLESETALHIPLQACVIGLLTSCAVGLLMVRIALAFLQKGNLKPCAWYCLFAGMMMTLYFNFV
jgi:undecaprenyl-diphosphatase